MDDYEKASFGQLPVGFGSKVGIVVIDFQICYTDAQYPFGGSPLVMRALANTARLLEVARKANVPVANCYTAYMSKREMPYWKIAALYELLMQDNPAAAFDPRIYDEKYDLTICKKGPSIFFDTSATSFFNKEKVDTVIVTGCNTSGCIRASVIDSFSHCYRTIVPEDCVGDLDDRPHQDNLRDMGRRYADISDAQTCIDWINCHPNT